MILYHVQTRLGHERVTTNSPSPGLLIQADKGLQTITRLDTESGECHTVDSDGLRPAYVVPRLLQIEAGRQQ